MPVFENLGKMQKWGKHTLKFVGESYLKAPVRTVDSQLGFR